VHSPIVDFFSPPKYEGFEKSQKARFLHVTLFVIGGAGAILGYQNMFGDTHLDLVIFILSVFSILCIPLNKRGYYTFVAYYIAILILAVLTFSMIDGIGLLDAGMIVYPLYIILASYLFSKKAALISSLLSIGSISLVYLLDLKGLLDPPPISISANFIVIIVLLVVAGFLLWTIMENWESVIANLRDTCDRTLIGWSKALEYRDFETEGHSQRVAKMSMQLARHFELSERERTYLKRGALLHDIGKMATPDAVLLKPGKLTEEEWVVIREHPRKAKEMLENIPFLKPALDVPYYHHERWDGSGYPEGISGKTIPLSARIFAVVDVWDALCSDRPYRKAWSREKAKAYIQENSGILFDPGVVPYFLDMIED
jgi:putative nucleotidyltransferase with HDIG domain